MSKNNLPGEAFSDRENAETYEQLDLSELIYGMPMGEADFMLNEAQEIQYNEMCQECRQDCKQDRKSTRLNSSHKHRSRMPSSA